MTSLFRTMRRQFATARLGIQMGQALFRLCAASLFGLLLALLHYSGMRPVDAGAATIVAAYLCFALGWVAVVRLSLLRFKTRMIISIVLEQTLFAAAFFKGGELLAPMLWAPVSVALAYGLLGGGNYARFAALLGAAALSLAFAMSPFWRGMPLIAAGIVLATVLIPWHAARLAEKIRKSRKEIQRRAAALEAASKTDALTGALNRAGFAAELGALIGSEEAGGMSAMMLLDLDGFKDVNDSAGHAAGDELLKEVVRRLRKALRASDRIGRIGGDEFGILALHLVNEEDAEWLAYKVLRAIEAIRIPTRPELRITASIGIQSLPDPACADIESTMEAADRLMYAAKRSGKNQYRTSADASAGEARVSQA